MKIPVYPIGGFLGSGKTTLIANTIQHFLREGLRPGVVTNDQAEHLVDTLNLKATGVSVAEVAGSCFCCDFNSFGRRLDELKEHCDVILVEPVGSCTDITTTVLLPLQEYHGEDVNVRPFTVLMDPLRAQALLGKGRFPFPAPVRYIYDCQLKEADIIAINKSDTLGLEEIEELQRELAKAYPEKTIRCLSGQTGRGIDSWLEYLNHSSAPVASSPLSDVNYDTYADGEAQLAWLNASSSIRLNSRDELLRYVQGVVKNCREQDIEIAHLKVRWEGVVGSAQCQVSSNDAPPSLVGESVSGVGTLTTNARVTCQPEGLTQMIKDAHHVTFGHENFHTIHSFQPSRPEPTYR